MINLKKYTKDWKLVEGHKRTYKGDQYFRKVLMHKKSGVAVAFWNDLDPVRFKIFFRMEMFFLDPKTGKELSTSPIWNQWEIKEEKQYFMEGLEALLKEYTYLLADHKPGEPLPLPASERETGQMVWQK